MNWREDELAQDVQRGRGDIYSTKLEHDVHRVDGRDGIVRKDGSAIQRKFLVGASI